MDECPVGMFLLVDDSEANGSEPAGVDRCYEINECPEGFYSDVVDGIGNVCIDRETCVEERGRFIFEGTAIYEDDGGVGIDSIIEVASPGRRCLPSCWDTLAGFQREIIDDETSSWNSDPLVPEKLFDFNGECLEACPASANFIVEYGEDSPDVDDENPHRLECLTGCPSAYALIKATSERTEDG